MKLRIVMLLVLSAAALTGCQQLNDGVSKVNGAISSSLSSVGKALNGSNDAVLTYKKGQKVSVTGTVNNFEVRGFATVNNADMPVRLVVLRNGTINH